MTSHGAEAKVRNAQIAVFAKSLLKSTPNIESRHCLPDVSPSFERVRIPHRSTGIQILKGKFEVNLLYTLTRLSASA